MSDPQGTLVLSRSQGEARPPSALPAAACGPGPGSGCGSAVAQPCEACAAPVTHDHIHPVELAVCQLPHPRHAQGSGNGIQRIGVRHHKNRLASVVDADGRDESRTVLGPIRGQGQARRRSPMGAARSWTRAAPRCSSAA